MVVVLERWALARLSSVLSTPRGKHVEQRSDNAEQRQQRGDASASVPVPRFYAR
jgi:hypothetical protein